MSMSPQELEELIGTASAMSVAMQSGLLEALTVEPTSPDELGQRLGLAPAPIALLLDVLVELGMAERVDGRYRLSDDVIATLDSSPMTAGALIQLWGCLPEFVRTGQGLVPHDVSTLDSGFYEIVVGVPGRREPHLW